MNSENVGKVSLNSQRQAELYVSNGNFGRAFAHLLVAIKLKPTLKNDLKEVFTRTLQTWSNQLEDGQRYEDLFKCYEQAIDVFPENETLYKNLGLILLSCDIHPDGFRFATGGQANDSGIVAIWNFNAITDPIAEKDDKVPKLLCQLDGHLSCVNCVRWSHSGTFLASGSDDKLIMIWRIVGETTVDKNIITERERWRCVGTLTGHSNDVLDLAWAPHDSWLASCSVDNTIIVWNMMKMPEIVTRLTGHDSLVKGVTWDPVGQYLASQSDDKTLRIWRVSDWCEQVCITEPFQECGSITHVLRLCWAPDGQALVSAHAMNNGGPTAKIIEITERPITSDKYSWSCEMDFVGHRKAVTCIRFNDNLLQRKNEKKYCVLATGSRDCSVAVWSTNRRRPIIVIKNVFTKAVLDFSWSKDGMQLLACSWDGTIAIMVFTEAELGSVLSEEEKTTALEAIYGKSFALKHLTKTKVEPVSEIPIVNDEHGKENESDAMDITLPSDKSILSNTFVKGDGEMEKLPSDSPKLVNGDAKPPIESPSTATAMITEPCEIPTKEVISVRQIETRTADGKRRITPITLTRCPTANEKCQSFSASCDSKTKIIVETVADGNACSAFTPTPETSPANVIGIKRKSQETPVVIAAKAAKQRNLLPVAMPHPVSPSPPAAHPNSTKLTSVVESDHILEGLSVCPSGSVHVQGVRDCWITIEQTKPGQCGLMNRHDRISGIVSVSWSLAFGEEILAVRSNSSVTVVCTKASLLYPIDTSSGFYLRPPIKLTGLAACLVLVQDRACTITTRGHLTLWNISTGSAILQDQTLRYILTDKGRTESVVSLKLAESGSPIVVLSNGCTYCMTQDWGWSVISDLNSLIYRESLQNPLIRSAIMQQDNKLPLKTAMRTAKNFMVNMKETSAKTESPSAQISCSAFLVHQMSSALVVKSSAEYKYLLLALIRLHVDQDNLIQVKTLLMDLLDESKSTPISDAVKVLAIEKVSLITECLKLILKNVSCERLHIELFEIFERKFLKKDEESLASNGLTLNDLEKTPPRPTSPFSVFN